MLKTFTYELKPNKAQAEFFSKCCGTARYVYNWALTRLKLHYEETGEFLTAYDLSNQLTVHKNLYCEWMNEIPYRTRQEPLFNLEFAIKKFFRDKKTKKITGFPKYKKRKSNEKFFVGDAIKVGVNIVKLPNIGKVRLKHSTENFEGKLKSVTIVKDVDRWFIRILSEVDHQVPTNTGSVIGIDLGLNSFSVTSEGEFTKAPKPLKANLELLQRRSRQHSKKLKGSNNRRKSQIKLAKLHRKIRNIRKDFLHKLTTHLTRTKSVIVLEDLTVSNMVKNHCLARSINDVAWSSFRNMIQYKAEWYGCKVIFVDRYYPSSKLCSNCGHKKDTLTLGDRTYYCYECGLVVDRDLNAALNLSQYGIRYLQDLTTVNHTGSNASGDATVVAPMNEELTKVM